MIYPLRKRHFIYWIVLAVVLPMLFIMALLAIQKEEFGATQGITNPHLEELGADDWIVVKSKIVDKQPETEIILKRSVSAPSILVYAGSGTVENSVLIGSMNAPGIYHYPVQVIKGNSVILYDPIKATILHKLTL